MKAPLLIAVVTLLNAFHSVHAADCTPDELAKVMATQQDPSLISACGSLLKDPSQPASLTNIDFCRSPSCIEAIKRVTAALPDCDMNGISISMGTNMLLASCGPAGQASPPTQAGPTPAGASGSPVVTPTPTNAANLRTVLPVVASAVVAVVSIVLF